MECFPRTNRQKQSRDPKEATCSSTVYIPMRHKEDSPPGNISRGSSFLCETENRPRLNTTLNDPRRLSDATNIAILNKKDGWRRVLPRWIVMIANRKLSSLCPHSQPTELRQDRELKTDLIKHRTNLTGVTLPSPPLSSPSLNNSHSEDKVSVMSLPQG